MDTAGGDQPVTEADVDVENAAVVQISPSTQTSVFAPAPGLEALKRQEQIYIHQEVDLLEMVCSYEMNNKYQVLTKNGRMIYDALEDTGCCTRNCCGKYRPFKLKFLNESSGQGIMLQRKFACDCCCCPCWLQKMKVFSTSTGELLGSVEQAWSICKPRINVLNERREVVLKIKGPCCTFKCCKDVNFPIFQAERPPKKIGSITKKWGGIALEMFTDADNFVVNFPKDLNIKYKALLMAACILIDFMYYERSGNN